MRLGFLGKKVIERYFLEREMPYTKRRPINTRAVYLLLGGGTVLFVGFVIFFGAKAERRETETRKLDYSVQSALGVAGQAGAGSLQATPDSGYGANYLRANRSTSFSQSITTASNRTRNAAQVIHRGEGGKDLGARLPMGYGISATLINAIHSSDSLSPVIAEVTQDVFPPGDGGNTVSIPTGARAFGNATYDDSSQRIQIHFHTLVYPEGDQHSFQGIGLMDDGSAGLVGDYHSGESKRQIGSFLGNFIGGMAQGMKDKVTGGQAGIPYEPGSLKNGLLSGVSQSAADVSRSYSDNLRQTRPTMSLAAGQSFVIFLEHEYTP